MKQLTTQQAIVLVVLILTIGALTYFGLVPREVVIGLLGWLIPSPIVQKHEESTP